VVLDRHSPRAASVQMVRDESHRFAVTFHRKRRQMRDLKSELLEIPGVGERTRQRLLQQHFGSVRASAAGRCRRAGRGADQASKRKRCCGIFRSQNQFSVKIGFSASNTVYERYPHALIAALRWNRLRRPPSLAATCVNTSAPNAARKQIVDCGTALWQILSEANKKKDKN